MAVAGKVAITLSTENGGSWSASVTYDRLVAVKHNNNLYISRKTVANVEPPNDEFWFLALEGFGGEDVEALIDRLNELSDLIQAIIDGTTQVGNAKTLDGHGAEYFATTVDLSNYLENKAEVLSTSILEKVKNLPDKAVKFYKINGSLYTGGDLPSGEYYKYSNCLAFKYDVDTAVVIMFGFGLNTRRMAVNHMVSNEWKGWQLYATDAELAKYIAKTEKPTGTYTGNGSATQRTINTGGIGDVAMVSSVNGSVLIRNGAVSFNGGTVTSLTGNEAWCGGGQMRICTTNALLNASGVTYTYNIL